MRRLGELELKIAKYDRDLGKGSRPDSASPKGGLGESTLFNETLISRV